jgi:hypothetical protein
MTTSHPHHRIFERVRMADGQREAYRLVCAKCGCSQTIQGGTRLPPQIVERMFAERGWKVGSTAAQDRCPTHARRSRHHQESNELTEPMNGATTAPQPQEPQVNLVPGLAYVWAHTTPEEQEAFLSAHGLMRKPLPVTELPPPAVQWPAPAPAPAAPQPVVPQLAVDWTEPVEAVAPDPEIEDVADMIFGKRGCNACRVGRN